MSEARTSNTESQFCPRCGLNVNVCRLMPGCPPADIPGNHQGVPAGINLDLAMIIAQAGDVMEDLQERFTSGNAVQVERATIKRGEWIILLRFYDALLADKCQTK